MDWGLEMDWVSEIEDKELKEDRIIKTRGSVSYSELRPKYIYRRAFSELNLINCVENLEKGVSYNFITSGDVDQVSYLSLVLRFFPEIDHLLFSTWCMSSEDILYLFELHKKGSVNKMDAYVGEIFPNSYPEEYSQLVKLYKEYPIGELKVFRNHSKIFAGISKCGQGFGVQTSANMNTNPRTENGNITIETDLYHFYNDYFKGINSFV